MAEQSASDYFTIEVKDYGTKLLQNLNQARLEERLCDFKIKVGEKIIHAHKIVLAEGCDYFRAMLSHPMKEASEGCVEIKEVDFDCLEICVEYIYVGKVKILKDKLMSLLQVAHRLQLNALCEAAAENLELNLSLESFFIVKSVANSLNLESLTKMCDEFALENLPGIAQQDDFVEIDAEYLKFLMTAKVSPAVKCKILLTWAKHDAVKRGKKFEEFFLNIDISKLPHSYVNFLVKNEALFYDSAKCLRKYVESTLQSRSCEDINLSTFQQVKKLSGFAVFDKTSKAIQAYNLDQDAWAEIHKMPPEICEKKIINDFTAAVVGGDIFVFAKDQRNWKINYLDKNATWIPLPNRSVTQKVNSVEISGQIYAFDETSAQSKAVEFYDGSNWSHVTNKELAGYETYIIAVDDSIYCMGGYTGNNFYCKCYKYETGTKRWTWVPSMPEKRSYGGIAEVDRKIYVLGGYCGNNATASGLVFNIETEDWTKISNMNQRRYDFRAICVAGNIYCIGGDGPNLTDSDDVEEFNTATGIWKPLSILNGKSIVHGASIPL